MYKKTNSQPQATEKKKAEGRKRKLNMNIWVSEEERDWINQRVALSGLLKRDFCVQSLMHQKVVCYGNIRVTEEMKTQLKNIEEHLENLKSAADLDVDKLEQLRMILELFNGLKKPDQRI